MCCTMSHMQESQQVRMSHGTAGTNETPQVRMRHGIDAVRSFLEAYTAY